MKRWGVYVALMTAAASTPGLAQATKPAAQSRTSPNAAAAKLIAQSDDLSRKGKFEEAAALLQKAAELTPDDWALWDTVGWAHLDNSKLPEATKAFEAARKAAPPGTPMLAGPVVVSYALGKKDELSKLLTQLTASDRLPAVLAVVEKGLAAKQFSVEWNYALGYIYANVLRNSGRAVGLIEAVAKADPKRAEAWLLLVEINRDLDRSAQEDAAAVKYLELSPESADAFRLRAERAAALHEYPTAIAEYKAGIEKAPGTESLYYQLARVYERTGAEKESEAVYRQLIAYAEAKKLTEMRIQARAALGAFQLRHRKYADAEKYYGELAAAPDATVSAWENWGASLALLAKWDEAAKAMKGAAERLAKSQTPGDPEGRDTVLAARYRAAVYEVAAGRREDAAKTLDAALADKNPVRSGAEAEAACFRTWLKLKEPETSKLAYLKSDERWAAFLWRQTQVDAMGGEREVRGRFSATATAWRAVLQQIQTANPDAWPADYALARIYAAAGFNKEGFDLLQKALRRKGDWWALHFAVGQYYVQQRDKDEGVTVLRRVLQLAPECRQARVYLSLLTNLKTEDDDPEP
jgi:tetratricopeptide (TPR) repeat protein